MAGQPSENNELPSKKVATNNFSVTPDVTQQHIENLTGLMSKNKELPSKKVTTNNFMENNN